MFTPDRRYQLLPNTNIVKTTINEDFLRFENKNDKKSELCQRIASTTFL